MSERPGTERSSKGGAPGVAATPEPARPDAPAKTVAIYERPEKNTRRSTGRFVGVLLVILVVAVVLFLIYWFL